MLRKQKDAGRFVLNQVLESWDTCIPLANPAAWFRMVQGMENSIRVKRRVIAPGAVKAIGRLAFGLEKLVPCRPWLPELEVRAQPHFAEHFGHGLGDLAEECL